MIRQCDGKITGNVLRKEVVVTGKYIALEHCWCSVELVEMGMCERRRDEHIESRKF